MPIRPSDLWSWEGKLDRHGYAVWGCVLFAVKYNLDRLAAHLGFGREWMLFSYLKAPTDVPITGLPPADLAFYGTLLAMALPFIYFGTVMTLRRLASAALPRGLVLFFFLPVVNLFFFFLALCVLPEAPDEEVPEAERRRRFFDALVPHSALGSAALALVVSTLGGAALTALAVFGLHEYGFGLFVGLPFLMGLVSTLIYGYHGSRTLGACLWVSVLSVLLMGGALLTLAFEGVICLVMAAPIGLALAMLGATVGYYIQRGHGRHAAPAVLGLLALFMPVLMGAESLDATPPPLIAVATTLEIAAPPEKVWPHVIAFSELPAPTELIFKTGIAYPISARIMGSGVGAVRRCEFTTGPFVEPITAWEPPTRLAFSVSSQPRSLDELSPYGAIRAPHIDHFLLSERGEFRLEPLTGQRTRLTGTTWYRHKIWPAPYWRLYSDAILHQIHTRVLAHVRALAEGTARPPSSATVGSR